MRAELQRSAVEQQQLRDRVEALEQALEEQKRQRSEAVIPPVVAQEVASEKEGLRVVAESSLRGGRQRAQHVVVGAPPRPDHSVGYG